MNYRLFHGSPVKGLTSLRPSSSRSFPVIYFSDEPSVAATYTKGRGKVYPVTVTMNRPLEPWGHTRFHKFLAIHMHNATRLAGDNDGLADDVETAQKWDLAMVVQ